MWASGTLFLRVPSPIPFPKKPPLVIESIAFYDCALCVPVSALKKDSILFLMYTNFGIYFIKKKRAINKIIEEDTKKIILIPDIKIKTDQLKKTNKVCPISGCDTNNKAITKVIKKENRYLK